MAPSARAVHGPAAWDPEIRAILAYVDAWVEAGQDRSALA